MAFPDPLSVTIPGVNSGNPISLARVLDQGTSSTYQNIDGTVKMVINHNPKTKKSRAIATVQLTLAKVVNDPITNQASDIDSVTETYVLDRPGYGFSVAETANVRSALFAFIGTAGFHDKLYGGEH